MAIALGLTRCFAVWCAPRPIAPGKSSAFTMASRASFRRQITKSSISAALPASRRVFAANRWADVPVWRRDAIGATETILGPAIVEEDYTTLYLAAQWRLRRIALGHLVANFEGVEA